MASLIVLQYNISIALPLIIVTVFLEALVLYLYRFFCFKTVLRTFGDNLSSVQFSFLQIQNTQ